jgi:dTDP-4-amino-4,6-dideoxygalactose transaminase
MSEELALLGGPRAVTEAPPVWPRIDDATLEAVTRVLRDEPLCPVGATGIQGEFEARFRDLHQRRFALATNSGTAALMLSLHGSGVLPGDEVVCSPFTWGASIACALQCGAIPRFADIDPATYALDPASVEAQINERTSAILVVHLFGYPAPMSELEAIASRHGLVLVEDCAQAAGGRYRGRRLGSCGHFSAFSLQASKNLTGGEGGILLCDERIPYERAMSMGTHPARLVEELELPQFRERIDSLAFNFRMHTASAAIANAQLDSLDGWSDHRRGNAGAFYAMIEDVPGVEAQTPPAEDGSQHAYYHLPLRFVPEAMPIDRDRFVEALVAEGVPAGTYVRVPFYLRPRLQNRDWLGREYPWSLADNPPQYARGDCPVAEAAGLTEIQLKVSLHEPCAGYVSQLANAFRKVASQAHKLS